MIDDRDAADLVDRHFDGGLDADEAERLMAWLREDPARVRDLVRAARMHGDLRHAVRARAAASGTSVGHDRASSSRRSSQIQTTARPGSWRSARPWIAAAAASLILALCWTLRHGGGEQSPAIAEVVAVATGSGPAPLIARPGSDPIALVAGTRVSADDRILTRSASVTVRSTRDATRFELAPETTASWTTENGSPRVALAHGRLRAAVAKQAPGSVLTLSTPHALVEVIGTAFVLAVDSSATSLEVSEGKVRFTRLHDGTVAEVAAGARASCDGEAAPVSPYQRWARGPSGDPGFFPIGVWSQDPSLAQRYRDAGFTCYVGLPDGPTIAQLDSLRSAGMPVVCEQNAAALDDLDDRAIIGWLGSTRPDDAPDAGGDARPDRISTIGAGAHAPAPAGDSLARYRDEVAHDATRPVLLTLGRGVAWDEWYGRGTRTGHPGDYQQYAQGCDLASFAIDPIAQREISGELWRVASGVDRLRGWAGAKPVWCFISCARSASGSGPTSEQLRSEAWMALIHGAKGLIFSSDASPSSTPAPLPEPLPVDASSQPAPAVTATPLFEDPATLAAVAAMNHRIAALAPALNAPSLPAIQVTSSNPSVPVAAMLKRDGATRYVFAIAMRDGATTAAFPVPDLATDAVIEVLDEDRRIVPERGRFSDVFAAYGVHLYAIRAADMPSTAQKTAPTTNTKP